MLPDCTPFIVLRARDGSPCHVWRDAPVIRSIDADDLRGLLAIDHLYLWRHDLPHSEFEQQTGLDGGRLHLRPDEVSVHDETVAMPEHFDWLFKPAPAPDVEARRKVVAKRLKGEEKLSRLYQGKFQISWYS